MGNLGNSTSGVGCGGGIMRSDLGPVVYPVVDRMIGSLGDESVRSGRGTRFVLGGWMFSFTSPGFRRFTGRSCFGCWTPPPSIGDVLGVVILLDTPGKSTLAGGAMT